MSYSRGTPNYNLPQTQGSDKRDWADTNAAFLALDTAVKAANDNASDAASAASTAQSTANNAATAASNAQSTANGAVSSASAAAELATTAKNRADSAYTLAESKLAKADVVNNVETTASGKALDARQGKALNDRWDITNISISWTQYYGVNGQVKALDNIRNINISVQIPSAMTAETKIGTLATGDRPSTQLVVPVVSYSGKVGICIIKTTGDIDILPLSAGGFAASETIYVDTTYII